MRLVPTQIEELSSTSFVLIVGMTFGVLQTVRELPGLQTTVAGPLLVQLILTLAAVFVWWAAVRRRRFSVWWAAWHLVLAWDLADVLAVGATVARFRVHIHTPWLDVIENTFSPLLVLSPIRFLKSAVLLAVGRLLPGSAKLVDSRPLAPNDSTAVS